MSSILANSVPEWYRLSCSTQNECVRIHLHVASNVREEFWLNASRMAIETECAQEEFLLRPFAAVGGSLPASSREMYCGFGECCIRTDDSRFTTYTFALPHVKDMATGNGDTAHGARSTCATLHVMFRALHSIRAFGEFPQILTVSPFAFYGQQIRGFSVDLSPYAASWADRLCGTLPSVTAFMRTAFDFMYPRNGSLREHWRMLEDMHDHVMAYVSDRGVSFCAGMSCGLGSDESFTPGRGYRLREHNLDNYVQALTLLTGIAAFCELVRAAAPPLRSIGPCAGNVA